MKDLPTGIAMSSHEKVSQKRVLSGIRATGQLHLGNYLGAVKGMLELQDNPDYETFYMVADVHAITIPFDSREEVEKFRRIRRDVVLDYLAAGVDPDRSTIFMQSDVPEHAEMSFYLSSFESIERMERVPAYKDKIKQDRHSNTLALFNYPILMAADILLYRAELVPLGEDQLYHLEITREIAKRLKKYGVDLPLPERYKAGLEGTVPSLLDSKKKMSKSEEGSYISLRDSLAEVRARLAKIPTDSGSGKSVPTEGGVAALFKLVELFEGSERLRDYEKDYLSSRVVYSDLKSGLAEAIYEGREGIFVGLKNFQAKRKEFEEKPGYVEQILSDGARKARAVASDTAYEIKHALGF